MGSQAYTKHTHINKVIAEMNVQRLGVFTKIQVEILCIIHAKKFRNIDVIIMFDDRS